MAESEGGGGATPWLAFLVGIVIAAVVAVGFFALSGAPRETAELDINAPSIETPDINLPPAVNPPDTNIDLPDVEINEAPPAQPAEQ